MHGQSTKGTELHTGSVVEEIMSLVNDSSTNVARLSAVLMKEPALMQNILRKANTPVFGFTHRVKSVDLAIVLLGFDVLKKTVSSVLIHGALRKMVDALFRYGEYWNHSVACAVIARYLSERSGKCEPDDAFICGLFHDIGHLVTRSSAPVSGTWSPRSSDAFQRHMELGKQIAERWNLPPAIALAIRWHHDPEQAGEQRVLAAIVHVADALCHTTAIARFSPEEVPVWSSSALELIGLKEEDVQIDRLLAYRGLLQVPMAESNGFEQLVQELKHHLVEVMANLPDTQKIIMALSQYEGLSAPEIAKLVNLDESAVSRMYADALSQLKNLMLNRV